MGCEYICSLSQKINYVLSTSPSLTDKNVEIARLDIVVGVQNQDSFRCVHEFI